MSYKQHQKLRRVKGDFVRFVPFSLFLIIPGAEIFLPAWVMIFPNSVPSQFVSDKERDRKFQELKDFQENAAEKLDYILPSYMQKLIQGTIGDINEDDQERIKELKALLRQEKALPTDLLEFKYVFRKYGQFHHF